MRPASGEAEGGSRGLQLSVFDHHRPCARKSRGSERGAWKSRPVRRRLVQGRSELDGDSRIAVAETCSFVHTRRSHSDGEDTNGLAGGGVWCRVSPCLRG